VTGVSAELRAILLNIICKILQILCRFVNSAHDAQFCMRWPSVQNSVCAEFWQTYLHCLTACGSAQQYVHHILCHTATHGHSLQYENIVCLTLLLLVMLTVQTLDCCNTPQFAALASEMKWNLTDSLIRYLYSSSTDLWPSTITSMSEYKTRPLKKIRTNQMVFHGKLSTGMHLLEEYIFWKCCLWPWPLNPWPWKCRHCHVDPAVSSCDKFH